VDCGELKFDFCLFGHDTNPDAAATALQFPPAVLLTDAHQGELPASGSLGSIEPACVRLLSLQMLPDGPIVRIQNRGAEPCEASVVVAGLSTRVSRLQPQEIRSVSLKAECPQPDRRRPDLQFSLSSNPA
jgi:hypothetical protein